ncbi:MAG: esterase-like activity of phytase family protein, partial [Rhodospirillales bacterium]|nr:esterase-like activity of phytase family protein [Rhodospirillales bacterium]
LRLEAESPRFGGFSALGISADGTRMVAISDRAQHLSARLTYDAAGNLAGIADADLGSLADLHGFPMIDPPDWDVEAMSPGVEGEIIVAFETRHRLWRYLPGRTVPVPMPPPDELLQMPANSGIKGLALLADGRLLALTPGIRGRTDAIGWVSDPDGWSVLTYGAADNFQVSGATTLPDGDVLVLERLYILRSGNAARLKRVAAGAIRAGAVLAGDTVAELRPPLTVDNFEGVEARRGANGETLIYLISDDNFNAEQRTLLMMFELMK